MGKVFFKIGTTDLSADVDIQNSALNSYDEYELWTDANNVEHRVFTRTRISGTIKVGFATAAGLSNFVSLLASARTLGLYCTLTAYVTNIDSTPVFDAYIDPVGEAKWDENNGRQWVVLTLNVRER